VTKRWMPALEAHRPQLIMISAGFDAHRDDPLANLELVDDDYAWVTRELCGVARKHGEGRIVATLEGGYALPALARSAAQHVRELMVS
jgi:acetoin utilization deacetylase AcuC-like enzyme